MDENMCALYEARIQIFEPHIIYYDEKRLHF